MKYIRPVLLEDFQRAASKIADSPFEGQGEISHLDVMRAHYLVIDYFADEGEVVSLFGIRDLTLFLSAIDRQRARFENHVKWKSPLEICATLFFGLIKNHPFHDGNKRTAFLTAIYHLQKSGRTPTAVQKEFEDLAINTAAGTLHNYVQYPKFMKTNDPEVLFIADFFRRKTREIDKRQYSITFQELANILKRYGCSFGNPDRNYIPIIREHEEVFGIFGHKKKIVTETLLTIGYPGWKRQVHHSSIKLLRKILVATTKQDIDSKVFYEDAEPLNSLIPEYHKTLLRLRDK